MYINTFRMFHCGVYFHCRFLCDATKSYSDFFRRELKEISVQFNEGICDSLGPSFVICHETRYTEPLMDEFERPNPEGFHFDFCSGLNSYIIVV